MWLLPKLHSLALAAHFAGFYALWWSGSCPGLLNTDDAIRETIIGAVLLLLVVSAHAHGSIVAFVALAATFLQHIVWIVAHISILSDTAVFYGTAVLPLLALAYRCPYIGLAGTYSFCTKGAMLHGPFWRRIWILWRDLLF